ncbi:unnamed protein product [Ambrosiozyma monospora]|uniref:Unnamed protein product n=1 Tax=Ambrosiozyma monospora TaxID=43982 RepID=A0A9W6YVW1_AMBMO|nr:unnamed protein product [Ambrosiozyma monospora]
MHPLLLESITSGKQNAPADLIRLHNESKYGKLDNLDSFPRQPKFPSKPHHAPINSISLDVQSNRYLLSGAGDASVKLWDLEQQFSSNDTGASRAVSSQQEQKQSNKKRIYEPLVSIPPKTIHKFGITHLKWWPDNGMWLSSSYDYTLNVNDATTMQPVHSFKMGSRVVNFDFDPSGGNTSVACCMDGGIGGIKLADLRTLSETQTLGGGGKVQGGYGYMKSCCWSPTNPYFVVGGGVDGYGIGWDIRASNGVLFKLDSNITTTNYMLDEKKLMFSNEIPKAHNGFINGMMFNEIGTELFTLGSDDKIRVWDLTTSDRPLNKSINFGPLVRNKSRQHITMSLSPLNETDVQYLWFPSDTGEILVFRANDGKLLARLNKHGERLNKRTTITMRLNHR